jgi:hypothetical protein
MRKWWKAHEMKTMGAMSQRGIENRSYVVGYLQMALWPSDHSGREGVMQ